MTQELRLMVFAGVIPGFVAGLGLLIAWWKTRKTDSTPKIDNGTGANTDTDTASKPVGLGLRWVAPLTLMIGYLLADYSINGYPKLWPDSNTYRFPHAAMLLGVLALLESFSPLDRALRGPSRFAVLSVLRAAALAGVVWLVAEGYYDVGTFTAREFYGWMAFTAIGGAIVIAIADKAASVASARVIAPPLVLIGGACIPILFFAGSASLGQVSAVLVAWSVATAVVSLLVPRLKIDRGGVTLFVGIVIMHAIGTKFQTYKPVLYGGSGLILLGGAAAGLGMMVATSKFRKRRIITTVRDAKDSKTTQARISRAHVLLAWVVVSVCLTAAGGIIALEQPAQHPNDPYSTP